jgi:hypothetical protein
MNNTFPGTTNSDADTAELSPRSLPTKIKNLKVRASYEPPRVISFKTDTMTSLKPVTMMGNM